MTIQTDLLIHFLWFSWGISEATFWEEVTVGWVEGGFSFVSLHFFLALLALPKMPRKNKKLRERGLVGIKTIQNIQEKICEGHGRSSLSFIA